MNNKRADFGTAVAERSYLSKDPNKLKQNITVTNSLAAGAMIFAIVLAILAAILNTPLYLGLAAGLAAISALAALQKVRVLKPFLQAERKRHAAHK